MAARFYTVFSPEGAAPAKVQHVTHKEAFSAAARMAKAFPGQTFYVMKSASAGHCITAADVPDEGPRPICDETEGDGA